MSSEDKRIALVNSVSALAQDLPQGCAVMITSRPHEYRWTPFASDRYRHYSLCEFDDDEIKLFIQGWRSVRETNPGAVNKATRDLWDALQGQPAIRRLAGNALLLTMIVRVHWWLGQLPESRLQLYRTCADALLHHWSAVKGLRFEGISLDDKREFLAELAYAMQSEAAPGEMAGEGRLQIPRPELRKRLERFLMRKRRDPALVDPLIQRLHTRDAILVNFGEDRFGFVHRSFQEYFAACRMADEKGPEEIWDKRDGEGWNETVYLAVAQLPAREQRKFLLRLLTEEGRAEFALACVQASARQSGWLGSLIRFLAKYTWDGREFENLSASDGLHAEEGGEETLAVLRALFDRRLRDGQVLAAAVELAEHWASASNQEAAGLVEAFFAEAADLEEDMVAVEAGALPYGKEEQEVYVAAFRMDRHPVTNAQFEAMIPRHRDLRDRYSDQDGQPVICVNWYEARLYARWRGCRLPSEHEWEKAASWDARKRVKREYPWDGPFDNSRCNTGESEIRRTTPVGAYPQGRSPYGCEDMAGNVWEWTDNVHEQWGGRVVRGGSWNDRRGLAACAYRVSSDPQARYADVGFRCART